MRHTIDPFGEPPHVELLRALTWNALRRLHTILEDDSQEERDRLNRDLAEDPHSFGTEVLGELVTLCDTDRAARREVLRGIRDILGD